MWKDRIVPLVKETRSGHLQRCFLWICAWVQRRLSAIISALLACAMEYSVNISKWKHKWRLIIRFWRKGYRLTLVPKQKLYVVSRHQNFFLGIQMLNTPGLIHPLCLFCFYIVWNRNCTQWVLPESSQLLCIFRRKQRTARCKDKMFLFRFS